MVAPAAGEGVAKLLIVGGIVGAIAFVAISLAASVGFAICAAAGWIVLVRKRPTSRWALGWSAIRSRR